MIKPKWIAYMLLLAAMAINGCKKDDEPQVNNVPTGVWRPAEAGQLKYVVITDDGYEHLLSATPFNLHIISSYAYSCNDGQIYLEGDVFNGGGYFNFQVSNDSLYVQAPGYSQVFLKDNSGIDVDAWTTRISVTPQYHLPFIGNFGPIEWNGTEFLIQSGYIPKRIYKFNPSTQQVYDSIDLPAQSYGFCYHNGGVWVNYPGVDNKLHQVSLLTGVDISASVNNVDKVIIPASDGSKIWVFGVDNKLYSYNELTNLFTDQGTFASPFITNIASGYNGVDMAIKDGYGYLCLYNYIAKLNLSTLQIEKTYQLTSGSVAGIAYDGTDFWINSGTDFSNLSISKINLP